jgi:hypothetical protein
MLVSIGLGWARLPQTMPGPDPTTLKVEDVQPTHKLGTVTRAEGTLSNTARAMILESSVDRFERQAGHGFTDEVEELLRHPVHPTPGQPQGPQGHE